MGIWGMKKRKTLYLIRHGKPEFQDGVRRCIGWTELPLSEEGVCQADRLSTYFETHPVEQIFTSPLGRCVETAQILAGGRIPVQTESGLKELYMGEWENVPLRNLKKELESEPEQGEGRVAGLERFRKSVSEIAERTEGDVAIVAHAGVNCCFLAELLGIPLERSRQLPQPYGGISRIAVWGPGEFEVEQTGVMPKPAPDEGECRAIWEHYQTPQKVREHCLAVSKLAVSIGERLNLAGCGLNMEMIRGAALLHDVARADENHAAKGAEILQREGYPAIAEIIRRHHDLEPEGETPDEAEVVYLADKLVRGSEVVTLAERFADSRKRCASETDAKEALAAHERRYRQAKQIEAKILDYIEKGNPSK